MQELCLCGLSCDTLDYKDERTKRLVKEILFSAKERFGIEYENRPVSVCVFPSSDGGCELFVTVKEENAVGYICFLFGTEELFCLCEALDKKGFDGISSLYLSQKNELVFAIEKQKKPSYTKKRDIDFSFLSSFGKVYRSTPEAVAFLDEHMKILTKNDAMKKLTSFF